MTKHAGTQATKAFYETIGWSDAGGRAMDTAMFGVREDGPIRRELHRAHVRSIRAALRKAGSSLRLLECGCGGTPAFELFDLCAEYVGVDFTRAGIEMARTKLATTSVPHRLAVADVCELPFRDGEFDAVYSAHVLYHIADPAAQARALEEMMRVLRPGGVLVLVTANPYPLLFPLRALTRLVADAPVLGNLARRLREPGPLPYRPMPLPWMRRRLARLGSVDIGPHALPSTAWNHRVTERHGLGRRLWELVRWIELGHPRLSTVLGNYVQITVVKPGEARPAREAGASATRAA